MKVMDERDCCDLVKDLKPYYGAWRPHDDRYYQRKHLKFCVHCGQLWGRDSVPGPAGDSDIVRVLCYPGEMEDPRR